MLRGGYNDNLWEQQEESGSWPFSPLDIATLLRQRRLQQDDQEPNQSDDDNSGGLEVAFVVAVSLMGFICLIWCVDCCRHCWFDDDHSSQPPSGSARPGQVAPSATMAPNKTKSTTAKAGVVTPRPSSPSRKDSKVSFFTRNTQSEHAYR